MKKQSLIKGTFILGIAGIFAKFLGLFFRLPLTMLIGDEGIGYYQMSYPLYMFFVAIAAGVPVAISKIVSEKNTIGDREGTVQALREALFLMFIMGGSFTLLMLLFSKQLIALLQWDNKSYYSLIGIALAPICISIMSAYRGFFQGMQNMNPTAVSQIIEQMGRVIIGIGLAYLFLQKGIEYSAGGAAFGAAAGGVLGGIYLIYKYLSVRREFPRSKFKREPALLGKILYIAVPISLGATVSTVMSLIDSALVPQKLLQAGFTHIQSTILYGQLTGKAFVLIHVPLTLSMALCASLVPIIAGAYVLNRRAEVINRVDVAIKLSTVIAFPSLLGLYFMASPVLHLIFPKNPEGYLILKYLSLSLPFIILSQTTTAILQGINRYFIPVVNLAVGCIIKIVLTFFLVSIPTININGAIFGTIAGYMVAAVLNMKTLKSALNISIDYYDLMIKPALASIIMIVAVVFSYLYILNQTKSNTASCLISVFLGILIYTILIVLFGIFKYSYIKKRFLRL